MEKRIRNVVGTYSENHLSTFIKKRSISEGQLEILKELSAINKNQLEAILGCTVSDKEFYWIKELGLSIGSFLNSNICWEFAALASPDPLEFNYYKAYVEIASSEALVAILRQDEIRFVKKMGEELMFNLGLVVDHGKEISNDAKLGKYSDKVKDSRFKN